MKKFQYFIEKKAFGVCSRLGEIMGISSSTIRLYFIYSTFLAFGSPIIIYLSMAFWMNVRRYIRRASEFKDMLLG